MLTVEKVSIFITSIIYVTLLVGLVVGLGWLLRLAQATFNTAGYGILLGFLMCGCLWALWAIERAKK